MTVKELIKILQDMPGEAPVSIGEDYEGEASTVTLMRKYSLKDCTEIYTTVNIDG